MSRYEIEAISATVSIDELTTEAVTLVSVIENAITDVDKLLIAKQDGNLTVENARQYLSNIATENDILDYESELTIEASYNFQDAMRDSQARSDAKITDIVTKVFLMIYEGIKKFFGIFRKLIMKVRVANKLYVKKAESLLKLLNDKLDASDIEITDTNLKQQVFDLIGAYALQYDQLAVGDGIAGAMNTPKDYSKLVNIITGLGKWNDSLLNENVFDLSSLEKDEDWINRHSSLLESWNTNVGTRKIPSSLLKLSEDMKGKIFGSTKHVSISGFGMMGYFENRLGVHNLAFMPFGLDGTTIHMVTAYNQSVGKLMTIKGAVKYDVKDMRVEYPTISGMTKCLKDMIKQDYKELEKDIMSSMRDIEKEFKGKIDTFISKKIKEDSVDQLHITSMLRGIYGGNIGAINSVAMSIVTHTLRNNNNLLKYIDLMSSQLENKPNTSGVRQLTN